MYLLFHFLTLKTLVKFTASNIGALGLPMLMDDFYKSTRFWPVSKQRRFMHLLVLEHLRYIELRKDEDDKVEFIYLTNSGWEKYHQQFSKTSSLVFQCIWNVIILVFGYYLGSS